MCFLIPGLISGPNPQMQKPHLRLHCNLEDRKPLWWVTRILGGGGLGTVRATGGYTTAAAAVRDAWKL